MSNAPRDKAQAHGGANDIDDGDADDDATYRVDRDREAARGYRLHVVGAESGASSRFIAVGTTIVIGRDASCDLVLPHRSVSRRHAELSVEGGLFVRDMESINGVRVGGRSLARGERIQVRDGELVEVGSVSIAVQRVSVNDAPEGVATSSSPTLPREARCPLVGRLHECACAREFGFGRVVRGGAWCRAECMT